MKTLEKVNFRKAIKITFFAIAFFAFANFTFASSVNFTQDTNIIIDGVTLVIKAVSGAELVVVNNSSINITLAGGDTVTIDSPSLRQINVSDAGFVTSTTCTGSAHNVALGGTTGVVTITLGAGTCSAGPVCGDAVCNGTENCSTCSADCGSCGSAPPPAPPPPPPPPPVIPPVIPPIVPVCGDASCNGAETCATCSTDCGVCSPILPFCGDDMCNGSETCTTCSSDCGVCAPVTFCGDASCNGSETCSNCSSDCGVCPPPVIPPQTPTPTPTPTTGGEIVNSVTSAAQNVAGAVTETVSNAAKNIEENVAATVEVVSKAISNVSSKQVKEAARATKEVASEPAVQATTEAVVGVATAVAVSQGLAGTIFAQIPALSDIFLVLVRTLGLIAEFLGIKKRTKKWGVVYDAQTKRPLDPAYVTIYDAQGKEMESKVTDMDGRFGFLVGSGAYKMVAHKTNYAFPATTIPGTSDELYDPIYKGELIEINNPDILKLNIPMDPVGVDWNEQIKKKIMSFNPKKEIFLKRASSSLFWFGLVLSPIIYWALPSKLNLGILISYLVLALLRTVGFKSKNYGRIYDKITGKPVPFAKIKVLLRIPGLPEQRLLTAVSDVTGRYYILVVGKGEYILSIAGTAIDGRQVSAEVPVSVRERVINFDIAI